MLIMHCIGAFLLLLHWCGCPCVFCEMLDVGFCSLIKSLDIPQDLHPRGATAQIKFNLVSSILKPKVICDRDVYFN